MLGGGSTGLVRELLKRAIASRAPGTVKSSSGSKQGSPGSVHPRMGSEPLPLTLRDELTRTYARRPES